MTARPRGRLAVTVATIAVANVSIAVIKLATRIVIVFTCNTFRSALHDLGLGLGVSLKGNESSSYTAQPETLNPKPYHNEVLADVQLCLQAALPVPDPLLVKEQLW